MPDFQSETKEVGTDSSTATPDVSKYDNCVLALALVENIVLDFEQTLSLLDDPRPEIKRIDAVPQLSRLTEELSHALEVSLKTVLVKLPLNISEPFQAVAEPLRRTMFEYGFRLNNDPYPRQVAVQLLLQYDQMRPAFKHATEELKQLLQTIEASSPDDSAARAHELVANPSANAVAVQPEPSSHKNRQAKRKRGGQTKYDPKDDQRVAEAWASGRFKKRQDLANELKVPVDEVRQALDRDRKRKRKQKPATE